MRGWILDIYPDLNKGKMVIWFKTNKQCYKITQEYETPFYVRALDGDYREIVHAYDDIGFETSMETRKIDMLDGVEKKLMKVSPGMVFDPRKHINALEFFNGHRGYEFYNVDIPLDLRFLTDRGIMPSSLVDMEREWKDLGYEENVHYTTPPLKTISLDIDSCGLPKDTDTLKAVSTNHKNIEGDEGYILRELNRSIRRIDPDVIITSGGDSFVLPYLFHRAELNSVELTLGREKTRFYPKNGRSYHSYGRVLYRPPAHLLKGRIHIDSRSSFMYRAGGLEGLIEISRLSKIPLQRLSRRSPGAAIDAMELIQVIKEGYLIPWKKNFTERFKSARHLLLSDRGGYIFEPRIGIHEDVLKFDFASMYPSIIDRYNLSPETLNDDGSGHHNVPELEYSVCSSRRGVIPTVVAPVIRRRQHYKSISNGEDKFSQRADCLKWLLVTCFGYTGYKKARLGSIEVHESITAYGRDILLEAAEIAQEIGYEVLHGIVDSLWLKGRETDIKKLIQRVNFETGIELEWEGKYRWLIFLASKTNPGVGVPNRYFGKLNDQIEAKGVYLRRQDTPALFKDVQKKILEEMVKADAADELKESIPKCLEIVKDAWIRLKRGKVTCEKLYFTKTVGKKVDDYKHMTETKAALIQYADMVIDINPGQKVRYIVTCGHSDDYRQKVAVEGKEADHYDKEYYTDYLYRTAGELLEPFGYPEEVLEKKMVSLR